MDFFFKVLISYFCVNGNIINFVVINLNYVFQLKLTDSDLIGSELAAKVNAFLGGYQDFNVLEDLAKQYKLNDNLVKVIREIAEAGGDPRSCH